MHRFELKIEGMSCGHCVRAVEGALGKTPGVKIESVGIGSAAGEYEPSQTSADEIAGAVERAGYQATLVGGAS